MCVLNNLLCFFVYDGHDRMYSIVGLIRARSVATYNVYTCTVCVA